MKSLTLITLFTPMLAVAQASGEPGLDEKGLFLALTGVLIVFAGLASISLFIALLPKVLDAGKRKPQQNEAPNTRAVPRAAAGTLDDATLAAITMVLQAESERVSGSNLKVTMGFTQTPWALSNQMRVLPGRIS